MVFCAWFCKLQRKYKIYEIMRKPLAYGEGEMDRPHSLRGLLYLEHQPFGKKTGRFAQATQKLSSLFITVKVVKK